MKQPWIYCTHRRFERWMVVANPHLANTLPWWDWRIAALRDRTDRLGRSSMRWMVASLICLSISIVFQLIALVS